MSPFCSHNGPVIVSLFHGGSIFCLWAVNYSGLGKLSSASCIVSIFSQFLCFGLCFLQLLSEPGRLGGLLGGDDQWKVGFAEGAEVGCGLGGPKIAVSMGVSLGSGEFP